MKQTTLLLLTLAIATCLQAQLINGDLENWTDNETVPGWQNGGSGLGITKTSDAYTGDWAATIWTWYYYSPGYLVSGNGISLFDMRGGVSVASEVPDSVVGYYKFNSDSTEQTDTMAMVKIYLKRWDSLTMKPVITGYNVGYLQPSDEYTRFAVPVLDTSGQKPDSILVQIETDCFCNTVGSGNCCYLTVDAIEFADAKTTTSIKTNTDEPTLELYPSPATSTLFIKSLENNKNPIVKIFDISGKQVWEGSPQGNSIDVSELSSGSYFLDVTTKDGAMIGRQRFVKH